MGLSFFSFFLATETLVINSWVSPGSAEDLGNMWEPQKSGAFPSRGKGSEVSFWAQVLWYKNAYFSSLSRSL